MDYVEINGRLDRVLDRLYNSPLPERAAQALIDWVFTHVTQENQIPVLESVADFAEVGCTFRELTVYVLQFEVEE